MVLVVMPGAHLWDAMQLIWWSFPSLYLPSMMKREPEASHRADLEGSAPLQKRQPLPAAAARHEMHSQAACVRRKMHGQAARADPGRP